MNLSDSFESALRAIVANKLRSSLTMLGVVIGVGSVIAMIGIGEGTAKKSLEGIQRMGTDMLTIMPNWRRGGQSGNSETPVLKMEDVDRLKAINTVKYISGVVQTRANAKYGNQSARTSISGAEPQIAIIRNALKMHQGGWYTYEDEAMANRKCVLGYTVYDALFHGENAVGATVRIKTENFEVAGVIGYKGGAGFMNPDDVVYIPLKTAMTRLMGKTNLDQIMLQGINTELLPITQTMVESTLAQKRKNASGEEMFRVMNQGDWINR